MGLFVEWGRLFRVVVVVVVVGLIVVGVGGSSLHWGVVGLRWCVGSCFQVFERELELSLFPRVVFLVRL
jgi:hypothetical protein